MPVLETKQLARLLKSLPQRQKIVSVVTKKKVEEGIVEDNSSVTENLENSLDDE